VNSNTTEAFKIGEEAIETVDDFTYMGSKIAADGGGLLDVEQGINKATGAFAKLKSIWRSNISLHLKMYGCVAILLTPSKFLKLWLSRPQHLAQDLKKLYTNQVPK
jgi:hypothetical protein